LSELLGLFGGTFDPVHYGHLRLAEEARQCLGLAAVHWIPAGQPGHRAAPEVTATHRLDMVRLAVAGNPAFRVDDAEVIAAGPSYTVPTLERLRRVHGGQQPLVLLLGADAFAGLPNWHRWRELFELTHIAVSHRPGFPVDAATLPDALAAEFRRRQIADPTRMAAVPAGAITTFTMTQLDISATRIRHFLAQGKSPRYLLPEAVIDYIDQHHLYRRH